jgi:hypothetical protein
MIQNKKMKKVSGNDTAQKLQSIELLKPKFDKGKSLLKALQQRKTIREISDKKLSLQMLSDLLWAACGLNRKTGPFGIPGRTAATASNSQEMDVYVAMEKGTYLYDAVHHSLIPIASGDLRPHAIGKGQLNLGDKAAVRLIYVADIDKLANTKGYQEPGLQNPEVQKSYYFVDTGIIAGNVYLYAASQGLASWFHNCDKQALAAKLKLRADQRILFGQTVGYAIRKK